MCTNGPHAMCYQQQQVLHPLSSRDLLPAWDCCTSRTHAGIWRIAFNFRTSSEPQACCVRGRGEAKGAAGTMLTSALLTNATAVASSLSTLQVPNVNVSELPELSFDNSTFASKETGPISLGNGYVFCDEYYGQGIDGLFAYEIVRNMPRGENQQTFWVNRPQMDFALPYIRQLGKCSVRLWQGSDSPDMWCA